MIVVMLRGCGICLSRCIILVGFVVAIGFLQVRLIADFVNLQFGKGRPRGLAQQIKRNCAVYCSVITKPECSYDLTNTVEILRLNDFPMSLDFSVDLNLRTPLWPWSGLGP
jgi:hypothetical protein